VRRRASGRTGGRCCAVGRRPTATTTTEARTIRLGGVRVNLRANTRQVVTVNHRTGWHASVRMWTKDGDRWRRSLTALDGRTGYGGLVRGPDRQQGTGRHRSARTR